MTKNSLPIPDVMPVFPLPTMVLFPKVILPLRIFEPRYRDMLQDVLDSQGCIAIALLKPGWQDSYFGTPDVFPVVGIGRLVEYKRSADGTFRIILVGERRALIREWVDGKSYRRARIEPFADEEIPPRDLDALCRRLRECFERLLPQEEKDNTIGWTKVQEILKMSKDPGLLADMIADHFIQRPLEKQTLLETRNPRERERLLRGFLERRNQIPAPGNDPGTTGGSTAQRGQAP